MQIDKPEGDEPFASPSRSHSVTARELFVEPASPLPPEPPQALFNQTRGNMPRASELRSRLGVHPRSLLGMALIGGATIGALLLGRSVMKRSTRVWYRTLKKPSWTPPSKAFGIVWPVLYALSGVSAWRVWRSSPSKERTAALGLWASSIATNAAWTPLFFGKKKPAAALVDLKANLGSAAGYALAAGKIDRTAGLLMLPYLAWVTFAGTINSSVVQHNASGPFARLGFRR
jgi:tryptophan-rich sensory protein